MTSVPITRHGQTRLSQRGIRETDVDLLLAHGTEIGRDRIMLMARDAAKLIRDKKQEIARIERMTGKVLVVSDGRLVTAYHQTTPTRMSRGRSKMRRRAKAN